MGGVLACLKEEAVVDRPPSVAQDDVCPALPVPPSPLSLPDDSVLRSMSISDAVQQLWKLDLNRLQPDVDYKINVQKGKKPWWKEDKASEPLFTFVNESVWQRPTYSSFRELLDNYQAETGTAERIDARSKKEIDTFLSNILKTPVMQFCHRYCYLNHKKSGMNQNVSPNMSGFSDHLFRLWFQLYSRERGGPLDSSGFEHVFVGEIRDGKISGFHNWIRFAQEERKGLLDYRGYIKPKSLEDAQADSNDHLLTIQFTWKGVSKDVSTMFVGVSPEFEMALYTICFLCCRDNEKSNVIQLSTGTDVFEVEIVSHCIHGDRIGTTYPYVKSHYET